MAGVMRVAMEALRQALEIDAFMIENQCRVVYRLAHPAKQIVGKGEKFKVTLEPSGFSQTNGAGELKPIYFFWIYISCKPSTMGVDSEDQMTLILEYLAEKIHRSKFGELYAYVSKAIVNYRTMTLKTNSREVQLELGKDEIGATLMFWMSEAASWDEADKLEPKDGLGDVL